MSPNPRILSTLILAAVLALDSASTPDIAWARKAAFSGEWAGVSSDLLEWPQSQFGFGLLVGPLSSSIYLVPGIEVSGGGERDLTMARCGLDLRYMLPVGDRMIPYLEGGLTGAALRLDVLDHTGSGPSPSVSRKTYLRGGFELGGGVDLALGGNWSISAAIMRVWLGDVDSDLVRVGDRRDYTSKSPSCWELPRLAVVYWF